MDQINPRFLKSSKPSVPSYIKEQDQKRNQALNKYKQNLSSKPFPPDDVNEEEEDGDKDQEQHCRTVVTLHPHTNLSKEEKQQIKDKI
jgi:hypothetical protein